MMQQIGRAYTGSPPSVAEFEQATRDKAPETVVDHVARQTQRVGGHCDDLRGIAQRIAGLANGLIGEPPETPTNAAMPQPAAHMPGVIGELARMNDSVEESIASIRRVLNRLGI